MPCTVMYTTSNLGDIMHQMSGSCDYLYFLKIFEVCMCLFLSICVYDLEQENG